MPFNTHLSYPLARLDETMNPRRDEREARMVYWRPVSHLIKSQARGFSNFLDVHAADSLLRHLTLGTSATAEEKRVALDGMMNARSERRPRITLMHATVPTLSIDEADQLDEESRQEAVAIRFEKRVALPTQASRKDGIKEAVVLITFDAGWFSGATCEAKLSVRMGTDCQSVSMSVVSGAGEKRDGLLALGIPSIPLQKLFAFGVSSPATPPTAASLAALGAPHRADEVPEPLQARLAAYAQDKLRLHALFVAAAPRYDDEFGATRPLTFENMRVTRLTTEGDSRVKNPRMSVKAYVHSTCCECICGAHGLDPIEKRFPKKKFTGRSWVMVSFDMCARDLSEGMSKESQGICPCHGSNTKANICISPGTCLAGCNVDVHCKHEVLEPGQNGGPNIKRAVDGVWKRLYTQKYPTHWLELTAILSRVSFYEQWAKTMFGKSAPGDAKLQLVKEAYELDRELNGKLRDLRRTAAQHENQPSRADLERADALFVVTLQEGSVCQCAPPKSKSTTKWIPNLVRFEGPDLTAAQRQLARTHFDLFPRMGAQAPLAQSVVDRRAERQPSSYGGGGGGGVGSSESGPKRQRATPQRGSSSSSDTSSAQSTTTVDVSDSRSPGDLVSSSEAEMYEYVDQNGLDEAKRQIREKLETPDLPTKHRQRGEWFLEYIAAVERCYEPPSNERTPLGRTLRRLRCKYQAKYGMGGRIHPLGRHGDGPTKPDGTASNVSVQGAPRMMRMFMMGVGHANGAFGKDIDQVNSQPQILRQLAEMLTYADPQMTSPSTIQLDSWCRDRKTYIDHIAEVHALRRDQDMYPDFRKDTAKKLVIAMMFGGSYRGWVINTLERFWDIEPKSPLVVEMEAQLRRLRAAVFASREWGPFCAADMERLRKLGEKETEEDIERSAMARVCQHIENTILTSMRRFLADSGWRELSLIFDGLIVAERPGLLIDYKAMSDRIFAETGFRVGVTDKPMYEGPRGTWPEINLAPTN